MYLTFNSLTPGKLKKKNNNNNLVIFQLDLVIGGWGISGEVALRWLPQNLTLVPSGTKPLPEPMLTQISVAIWRH